MCMDCFQGSVHKSHRYKVGMGIFIRIGVLTLYLSASEIQVTEKSKTDEDYLLNDETSFTLNMS